MQSQSPPDSPLLVDKATSKPYGVRHYIKCLLVFWLIRLMDFLAYSMVIPTLQGFAYVIDGDTSFYYFCNFAFTAVLMMTRPAVGWYVDKTRNITLIYNILVPAAVASNTFYAFCPVFGLPHLLVAARGSAGFSAATESLMYFYLNLVATPKEMQEWTTYIAATRSIGYIAGPALGAALADIASPNCRSTWGKYGIVGWVLAISNSVLYCLFKCFWSSPPEKPLPKPPRVKSEVEQDPDIPQDISVRDFTTHWAIVAIMAGNFCGSFLGLCVEQLVPPTTQALFGWGGSVSTTSCGPIHKGPNHNGIIYLLIGGTLILGQVTMIMFNKRFSSKVSSGAVFMVGLGGMSIGMLIVTIAWSSITPREYAHPFGEDLDVFLQFTVPILIVAFFMPFCMNQSMALYMRIARHSLGARVGTAQAVVANVNSSAPLLIPWYQFWTYHQSIIDAKQPPTLCLAMMSALGFTVLLICTFAKRKWGH